MVVKMAEAKEINVDKFHESDAYKLALNTTTSQFLAKERVKMRQFL